jgi:DNA polymerase-2
MHVVQANSIALTRILETVLEVGKTARSGKLEIPPVVWKGDDEIVYGFVSGLLTSDGCVGRKGTFLRITSARELFVGKLGALLLSRGIAHRFCIHGHLHSLEIIGGSVLKLKQRGWLSKKHRRRLGQRLRVAPQLNDSSWFTRSQGPLRFVKVRSIEQVPSSSPFVYCFEVANELRGFVLGNGVFTANSFGYLGYRNARFGRIEAHESVTAYSREMLLRAKEVAEDRGYRMLHALVDSVWLHKDGAGRDQYEALAREVTAATNLPIYVEGVYRWISFLPSRTHSGVGVPNRYMGLFEDGKTKVRGIEVRRSDVPIIVERMQTELLQGMFRCKTLTEVHAAMPELLGIVEDALVRLRAGEITAAELAITNRLSQEPGEYTHNSSQAIAARSLAWHGARLHPGEAVQFIITNRKAKLPDDRVRPYTLLGTDWHYDVETYADFVLRAAETVLELFGYSRQRLHDEVWRQVWLTS